MCQIEGLLSLYFTVSKLQRTNREFNKLKILLMSTSLKYRRNVFVLKFLYVRSEIDLNFLAVWQKWWQ